jgi:hypothetical protein
MMRTVCRSIGTLLLTAFILKYWWLIALLALAVAGWRALPHLIAQREAEAARIAAIAARPDQQHAWVIERRRPRHLRCLSTRSSPARHPAWVAFRPRSHGKLYIN